MPKTEGSFKKGHKGFKPKGAVNYTTKEAKIILDNALLMQVDNIQSALERLYATEPGKYLDAISKLFAYVLPKKTDVTTDGEKVNIKLPDIHIG